MESYKKNPTVLRNIILDHYESPNHKVDAESVADDFVKYHNKSSTCIDDITVYLKVENDVIKACCFSGLGCAISISTSDIFCDILINKTINEAKEILANYKKMINQEEYDEDLLEELIAFYNIPNQPNRIKCSLIGHDAFIHVLENALNEK